MRQSGYHQVRFTLQSMKLTESNEEIGLSNITVFLKLLVNTKVDILRQIISKLINL